MNKKPTLAVVTHYKGERSAELDAMCASVRASLPSGAVHVLIHVPNYEDFERSRWEALQLADYVCFVDDDDLIINDGIRKAWDMVLHNPGIGCVFTNQLLVDIDDQPIVEDTRLFKSEYDYRDIAMTPQTIHHLAIIRSNAVHPSAFDMSVAIGGVGIDWLMKASAALAARAIHMPFYGYLWRQHPDSMSKGRRWIDHFDDQMALIQAFLLSHVYPEGAVPQSLIED